MKTIRKSIITLLVLIVVALVGAAVFPAVQNAAFAESNHARTRDKLNSLEELREIPVEEIAVWPQYDSRNYGIVTSVKNQGSTNLCWVYGSLAAMETNILRQGFSGKTNENLNLDEEAFARASKGQWDDPLDIADGYDNRKLVNRAIWNAEGAIAMVTQFAARGQGVYEEGEMAEDTLTERYSSYWLRNAITCDNNVEEIKKLIAEYGGVAFTYHSGLIDKTYLYARGLNDHAAFIIGWDDNLDKSVFRDTYGNTPQNDGGWIVKNSYGTGSFEEGYCYLSYDSDLFEITAFDMMSADEYDYCYNYSDTVYETKSYSVCSATDPDTAEYVAIYKAQKGGEIGEYLNAVSVGVSGTNAQVSVFVYANVDEAATKFSNNSSTFDPTAGTLAATAQYTALSMGIYTIPLNSSVELLIDSYFTILIKVSGGSVIYDRFGYRSGTMTYVRDSGKWNNLSSPLSDIASMGLLCIKALTVTRLEEEHSFDVSNGTLELSETLFTYTGSEHKPKVTLTIDGETVSPDNYTVEYENNINAGTATVKVEGKGNYTGSLKTTFVIAKAASPNLPEEFEALTVTGDMKVLAEIELPNGWVWQAPETQLVAGKMQVMAVYIGDDSVNYERTVFQLDLEVPPPEHRHELTLVAEKAATCTVDGHTSYYACSGCEKWFEDKNGEHEIIDRDSVIIPAAHDYMVEWSKDENGHWLECAVCNEFTEKVEHNSDGEDGDCSVCGYKVVAPEPDDENEGKTEPKDPTKPDKPDEGELPDGNEKPDKGDSENDNKQPAEPETPSENNPNNGTTQAVGGCDSNIGVVGFAALAIIIVAAIILITLRRSKK